MDQQFPHEYVAAQLGHSNQVCKWCSGTPMENAVLNPSHCDEREAAAKADKIAKGGAA